MFIFISPSNSGFSVSLLYHTSRIFSTAKGALPSSFRHLFITSINHRIAFSCHSDFGCIANPLYSYAVQAFPLGAMHPLALCEPPRSNLHSLASELSASFRLIMCALTETCILTPASLHRRIVVAYRLRRLGSANSLLPAVSLR